MYQQQVLGNMMGFKIVTDPYLTKTIITQTRWPRRHKKKWRVVKKFRKLYIHHQEVPDTEKVYIINGNTIVCHPEIKEALWKVVGGARP